jgi:hypothetical protein
MVIAMAHPLRAITAERSPERERLAEAIERHADAVRMLDANKAAQESTQQTRRQAQEAVERSVAMIEEAKTNAATHLTAQAMGTAGEAPLSVKAARDNAVAAQDALEAALSAGAALVEQAKVAERELQYAAADLDKAVREVVRAETGAAVSELLKQAEALQSGLVNRRVVLRHLLHNEIIDEAAAPAVKSFLKNRDMPGTFGNVEYQDWNHHPATDAWKNAHAALRQDADAALPI